MDPSVALGQWARCECMVKSSAKQRGLFMAPRYNPVYLLMGSWHLSVAVLSQINQLTGTCH